MRRRQCDKHLKGPQAQRLKSVCRIPECSSSTAKESYTFSSEHALPAIFFQNQKHLQQTCEGCGTAWQQEPQENLTRKCLQAGRKVFMAVPSILLLKGTLKFPMKHTDGLLPQHTDRQEKFYFGGGLTKTKSPEQARSPSGQVVLGSGKLGETAGDEGESLSAGCGVVRAPQLEGPGESP